MSKKRASRVSSNDEQTNEGSDSVFQQDGNVKRARLAPLHDTTLQDLPFELIECILVKVVAMEVKDMKLAKSVWKEKADLVISRLGTVCSQWSYIFTTNFFRNELQRTFDALKMVHMEMLHQYPIVLPPETFLVMRVITLKDMVFMLCKSEGQDHFAFNVYDRNNMAEVRYVIPLPGEYPPRIAACSVSNCIYALCRETDRHNAISILRITKEDEHQFTVSPLISDTWMPRTQPTLSITANGTLILSRWQSSEQLALISAYDANGSLQHEIKLSSDVWRPYQIIPKSNGNLVLVSADDQWRIKLTEIDMDGTILRQYQSSIGSFRGVCQADRYGRILIAERLDRIELLDSEFNLVDFIGPQLDEDKAIYCCGMHYDSERNEIVTIVNDDLTIFHFTE